MPEAGHAVPGSVRDGRGNRRLFNTAENNMDENMKKYNYGILGAGRQGLAAAYDLARFGKAGHIHLWDMNLSAAVDGAEKINGIAEVDFVSGSRVNAAEIPELKKAFRQIDTVIVAVPFKFIPGITQAAIEAEINMVDMGGHTGIVRNQLDMSDQAREKGIVIVPDCGMGPGMNITMALLAMEQMDTPRHVRIWDGGIPADPCEPWNYALFFNINGLTNEYFGSAYFLRDGRIQEVPCFEGYERLDFPEPYGQLEAAVTSGGLSTAPWTLKGTLETLENKTLRYPGHFEWMKGYRQLGLFEESPVEILGMELVPREIYHELLVRQLPDRVPDVCLMRVECLGTHQGKPRRAEINAVELYDSRTDLLAMEKWTGWHCAIVAILATTGEIEPGVISVEKAVSGSRFLQEAEKRGYDIQIEVQDE